MTGGSVPDVPPTTVVAASRTSSRPARGRLRSAARASARRAAAIRWSGDTANPRARMPAAASTKKRVTPSGPGWRNTWRYQPGQATPAP